MKQGIVKYIPDFLLAKYKAKILDISTINEFVYNNLCIIFPNVYEHCYGNDYFVMKI